MRIPTASWVSPHPVTIRCARCAFVATAPVVEAHAAFESHSCAAATTDNGRAKS